MSEVEVVEVLLIGWNVVVEGIDFLVVGEMGIGNMILVVVIVYVFYGGDVEDWVGCGIGVDDVGFVIKVCVVCEGVVVNVDCSGLEVLCCLGG